MLPLAILWLGLAVFAADARAQPFRVVVVPGLEVADLSELSARGAVGLLVPGAGPETSERSVRAALVRGKVRNSLRGGMPEGRPQISVTTLSRTPEAGRVIVLGLPRGGRQANDRRYPVAVTGAGYEGLLESRSTRIPGLVTIADIAPTALGREGALESRPARDPVRKLRELDDRIRANNRWRAVTSLVAGVLLAALALVAARAAVLAFGVVLATNLALGAAQVSLGWGALPVLAAAVIVVAPLLARVVRSSVAVALFLAAVLVAYLVAFLADGTWVALSPLGPTQNARFYGLSNLLETLLLVPALVAAAALARRHAALFAAVAIVAIATVAGSRFGADGGGAVVLAVAYAVLAALLARAGRRVLVLGAAAAVVVVAALVGLDAVAGTSTHVSRTLAAGPDEVVAALRDRVTLSYERAVDRWHSLLIVVLGALALAALVVRLARLPVSRARRALPAAFAAAIATSLVVNDSPVDVIVGGLVGYLALEAYALGDVSAAATARARLGAALPAPARA